MKQTSFAWLPLDQLTASWLESLLRGWQSPQRPTPLIPGLALLHTPGADSDNLRSERFFDLLAGWALQSLDELRNIEEIPSFGRDWKQNLDKDFRKGSAEVCAWSALYHRYFTQPAIRPDSLSAAAHISERHYRRYVIAGLERLCAHLRQAETQARRVQQAQHGSRLPDRLASKYLVGVEEHICSIVQLLADPLGPRLVSLEGPGGIGKTSWAIEIAHRLSEISPAIEILWSSARQESFDPYSGIRPAPNAAHSLQEICLRLLQQLGQDDSPPSSIEDSLVRLRQALWAGNYLVIIDNLETAQNISETVPALCELASVSKLLFTSRCTLRDLPDVEVIPLKELSVADSQTLLLNELKRHGRKTELDQEIMAEIHAVVGGLPLALKLVAAQSSRLPLAEVLTNLQLAANKTAEDLYVFLYRLSWSRLSDPARQLLLSMLLAPVEGETLSWISLASGMPPAEFSAALAQLLDFALLEVSGSICEPLYRIHRLTNTFLQSNVLQNWPLEAPYE